MELPTPGLFGLGFFLCIKEKHDELVANTVMALASDEKAFTKAIGIEENKNLFNKVKEAIKNIVARIKEWFKTVDENGVVSGHNMQAQPWLGDVQALEQLAQKFNELTTAAKQNKAEFGERESEERYAKKKTHYAKVGGNFSEALQSEEWAKFTDAMTNMDAGLRISKNSILVPCESGIYKYVIYDEIPNNRITAVYRFGGIMYNNVVDIDIAANKIARFIYDKESQGYAEPKILRRLLRDHCKNFGYVLDRYNPNSKRYASIGNGLTQNKTNAKRKTSGAGVSNRAKQSGKLVAQNIITENDRDYLSAVERGDMETAQKMVDEAAKAATRWEYCPKF